MHNASTVLASSTRCCITGHSLPDGWSPRPGRACLAGNLGTPRRHRQVRRIRIGTYETMTIVFIGDIHQQWHSVERGLAALDPLPSAAVLLGDIQCDRPLDNLAAPLLDRGIDVHWIFGNHDNDGGPEMWANLVEPERNPRTTQGALHARVVEIAGVRIAGLGGAFSPRLWETHEPA